MHGSKATRPLLAFIFCSSLSDGISSTLAKAQLLHCLVCEFCSVLPHYFIQTDQTPNNHSYFFSFWFLNKLQIRNLFQNLIRNHSKKTFWQGNES